MILRFREGSALHAELKRMNDVREATYKEACDIIEKLVGERPKGFGSLWGSGFTCAWNPYTVVFKDGFVPDPKLMSENPGVSNRKHKVYKVLRTTKKGREALDKFKRFYNSVTSDSLEKLGLPLHKESRYFYFMPSKDEAGYYLAVSNGIADVLKKNVDITIELPE